MLLFVPGVVVASLLPWRFAVLERGIALWFPFGKYRYLAKERITVRVGHGSTVLLPRRAERFGYPLTDGLVEQRRMVLRAVLVEHGFDVATLSDPSRGGGVDQAVALADLALGEAEHDHVDEHTDREQHDHHRLDARHVTDVAVRSQLLAEREPGDSADDLAGEQAAPRERPTLLEAADERRQRGREHHVPQRVEPLGAEHLARPGAAPARRCRRR